jgi:AraC-like DNA-binding protein/mannose-6-phosphate isomerase-like protein (cupin superfamily)
LVSGKKTDLLFPKSGGFMYQLETRNYWSDPNVPIQFEFRNPQAPFPMHIHDFHEIVLVYSGKATHLTASECREIQSGDFVSVKPGQAHGYKNLRNLVLMNILIKPSFFEEDRFGLDSLPAFEALFSREAGKNSEKSPVIQFRLDYGVFSRARELIEEASEELSGRADGYRAMVVSRVQECIILLVRNYKRKSAAQPHFAMDITTLFNYVKHNYRSPLNMTVLTDVSCMSESHVLRTFKQYLDSSPIRYINQLRLSAATDELIQTDKSITDIALDLGFNDSNYFTRLFKKQLGLSPREYRQKYLAENLL